MTKFQIKSIFKQIAEKVFIMKDVNQAKQFITEFIKSKEIKDSDKQTIIKTVDECKNITKLHQYICNSLLRYENLSVNIRKTEKKEIVEE